MFDLSLCCIIDQGGFCWDKKASCPFARTLTALKLPNMEIFNSEAKCNGKFVTAQNVRLTNGDECIPASFVVFTHGSNDVLYIGRVLEILQQHGLMHLLYSDRIAFSYKRSHLTSIRSTKCPVSLSLQASVQSH